MGLLQKAVETYDAHANLVGKIREGHQPLAPIGHTVTSAAIEITLDGQGCLVNIAKVDKDAPKIIIPVTEESAGRTSAPAPHPLCEQLGYLSGEDEKKFDLYVNQLEAWEESPYSHPALKVILEYVKKQTLLNDLSQFDMGKTDKKSLICWRVIGIGQESGPCWTNQNLFQSFTDWYKSLREQSNSKEDLCMITGETSFLATQHLKGIVPANGNAKLISSNDSANFTYRGRFTDDSQAATVSYEASQKAHNALRWLATNQGVMYGGRTFLCWNPQGKKMPRPNLPFLRDGVVCTNPTDYRQNLLKTLRGWHSELPEATGVVIAAFDAATSGRLSLTYYSELLSSDFLQRLHDWDNICCWWSWNSETHRYNMVQSPSLAQIVNSAFGIQRNTNLSTDDKIMKQQIQRLISCRVDKALFPTDIKQTLVNRASTPQSYEYYIYQRLLSTACAVIRKYHHDYMKEDLAMVLEKERPDRSYQFGRLLAVLEKVERDTYDRDENREPYAIRLQSRYSQHPFSTFRNIEEQLERAYFPRIKPGQRAFYKRLIGEIIERINEFPDYEWNKPLGDTYLIGYYLQRNELYKPKTQATQEQFNDQKED